MSGKIRPYEPLLMSLLRFSDALLGSVLFLVLSIYFKMYSENYVLAAALIFFKATACFQLAGVYRSWRTASPLFEVHRLILGCIAVYVLLVFTGFVLKTSQCFSRSVVLSWIVFWPLLLGIERGLVRMALNYYRSRGRNLRRAVIAGAGDVGARLGEWIDENVWSGTQVLGFFDDRKTGLVYGHPVLGDVKELPSYIKKHGVDAVYLALPWRAEAKIQWIVRELADSTASIYLVPDISLFDLILENNLMYIGGMAAFSLRDTPFRGISSLLKRIEDWTISAVILALMSPIMIAIAIAIKLTSRGPVIFTQWRYGFNGQPIRVYKFRTMTVCEDGYTFKQATRCDPRVTRVGSFLRRTSLDELPQFINVFQGRMSIVGPRPHPVAMNEQYRKLVPGYMLRHKVKPGITGLAQVNGFRGQTETLDKMQKRIEKDLEYLRSWTLMLDLKIIAETVFRRAWKTNAF
jgi:putative colanic acid biosynthesis UDP-glucose lipid carrier transferase